jgi:hypothetical protein
MSSHSCTRSLGFVDLGVDLDVEPGRQLWRQPVQGAGEQDPAEVAPAVPPRQPQPEEEQLGRRQGPQPGRVRDRRFNPVAHTANPGPRFIFRDETPLGSAGAGRLHRGDQLAQVIGVCRSAGEVRRIADGTEAHYRRATVGSLAPMVADGLMPSGDVAEWCARPHDMPAQSLRCPRRWRSGRSLGAAMTKTCARACSVDDRQQLHATA